MLATRVVALFGAGCLLVACSGQTKPAAPAKHTASTPRATKTHRPAEHGSTSVQLAANALLPGMPAPLSANDVYAADRPGLLSPVVRGDAAYVYVPNSESNTVDVIDQHTFQIVGHFAVGRLPQHVVPSYDLRRLWVTNDIGNTLTQVNPRDGQPVRTIPVDDPYNMYFTPDGKHAIVVAERMRRLDFRNAQTMELQKALSVPCKGVDHADFTANGRFALFSCEFSGRMLVVDVANESVVRTISLGSYYDMPQDVKLSPDGRTFYVADMRSNGVWLINAHTWQIERLLPTGRGAHGLYVSRDSRYLYVTNRSAGTISLVSFATQQIAKTWSVPGGSPDMGGLSADGKVLWLSGRYNAEVYAIDTSTGQLLARIRVGISPHGLCVWPQPGRYSLGHTGILR